jgi:hypothetical protein
MLNSTSNKFSLRKQRLEIAPHSGKVRICNNIPSGVTVYAIDDSGNFDNLIFLLPLFRNCLSESSNNPSEAQWSINKNVYKRNSHSSQNTLYDFWVFHPLEQQILVNGELNEQQILIIMKHVVWLLSFSYLYSLGSVWFGSFGWEGRGGEMIF